jgi:PAS domain S-box-containing protein
MITDNNSLAAIFADAGIAISSPALDLLNLVTTPIAYIDQNLQFQFTNKAFEKWSNMDAIAGKTAAEVLGKELLLAIKPHIDLVLRGYPVRFENKMRSTGGVQYLDICLNPDINGDQIKGFSIQINDITELKKAETALKDYVDTAAVSLHWVNAEGIITWANQAELTMLGYEQQEYIGHHIAGFHADQLVINDILQRLTSGQTLHEYEAVLRRKDGSTRYVAINSSVLWDEGKFVHTRCFTTDITEQKKTQLALKESEERYRSLLELLPVAVYTCDAAGYIQLYNQAAVKLWGREPQAGKDMWCGSWRIFDPSTGEPVSLDSCPMAVTLKEGRPVVGQEIMIERPEGTRRIIAPYPSPIFDHAGKMTGAINMLIDITEQKQAAQRKEAQKALKEKNKELERMNQELSSFAYVSSHDLQEPLRKIQAFTSRILEIEEGNFSQKGLDYFNRIQGAASRMRILIEDLLTYSSTNTSERKFVLTDLNVLVDQAAGEFSEIIMTKKAMLQYDTLPRLRVIPFQFVQLITNLVGNALKFAKNDTAPLIIIKADLIKGNKIDSLLANAQKTYHHICFSDNGIGFDPQYSSRIFEVFQRLHNRKDYEGTGVGLAICKKIVDNHEGIITAEGKENQGAAFHIYLPV